MRRTSITLACTGLVLLTILGACMGSSNGAGRQLRGGGDGGGGGQRPRIGGRGKLQGQRVARAGVAWNATAEACAEYLDPATGALRPMDGSRAVKVALPGVPSVQVYARGDIVSNVVSAEGIWSAGEVKALTWAMAQDVPLAAGGGGVTWGPGPELFVDIGANIGWMSLSLASQGHQVAAFEGMASNVRMIKRSLCGASDGVRGRVTLYQTALGQERAECFSFSHVQNVGDGHTDCKSPDQETAAARVTDKQYVFRNKMTIRRLDRMLPGQDIKVIKLDTEGYELPILQGAQGLLSTQRVWFMLVEFNPVRGFDPVEDLGRDLLDLLFRNSYRVSYTGFTGPYVNQSDGEQVKALVAKGTTSGAGSMSLYAVHRDFFEHAATRPKGAGMQWLDKPETYTLIQ